MNKMDREIEGEREGEIGDGGIEEGREREGEK